MAPGKNAIEQAIMKQTLAPELVKAGLLTDEAIMEQLQVQFQPHLFGILVRRYQSALIRRCLGFVKNEDTARDLAQEVFIKVFLQLASFRQDARFSHWLFTIAHNTSVDYLRRQKKEIFCESTPERFESSETMAELDPELPVELSLQLLDELLNQIPSDDKLLLTLKYYHKTSIKELQARLNLTESAVKMRLKRAREKISRLYQKMHALP
ncbi:MAG: RNA polymerase sigma factor [Microscillaceae bacterium]